VTPKTSFRKFNFIASFLVIIECGVGIGKYDVI
jgi:hypothetical protein